MTHSSAARAQIRELVDGGVIENGFGAELNWDDSLGGSNVAVTPTADGSWDIQGTDAVIVSGKGRNRTTCLYNASFSLNTRRQ